MVWKLFIATIIAWSLPVFADTPEPEATPATAAAEWEGLWPSQRLMTQLLRRWAHEIGDQYDLDTDQQTEVEEAVVAIAPLTEDEEGLAFWIKTGTGEYVLARILAVQPASHAELVAGATPALELEWLRPPARTRGD